MDGFKTVVQIHGETKDAVIYEEVSSMKNPAESRMPIRIKEMHIKKEIFTAGLPPAILIVSVEFA